MRSHIKNLLSVGILSFALLGGFSTSTAYAQYPGLSDPGASTSGSAGGSGLVPTKEDIDGGAIPIGATAQVVVLFKNESGQPIETGLIRLYPSSTVSAIVSMNQCQDEPLSPGAECAIAISVKGLQPGQWRVEMLMSHSGRARLVTQTVSGTVETVEGASNQLSSDIDTIPSEIDFGSLESSQTLVEPVVLRNITSNTVEIENIYIDSAESAGYRLASDCKKLEAGQACIATITWSPQLKGRSSGVLVVKHSGPTAISSVLLEGEFEPEEVEEADIFPRAVPGKGLLVSSLEEIDFGEDIASASSITVTLVNSGDAEIVLKKVAVSGSDNGVSFKEGGCTEGTVLEPIEACPLTITWSPTRVGELLDDIQVLHNGARGVLVMPVRGESIATVSQDQKAILLSDSGNLQILASDDGNSDTDSTDADFSISSRQASAASKNRSMVYATSGGVVNPASVLDGYKITSFSPTRAIINGPGGSRIVFDNEENMLGGIPWWVTIQKNGIEFEHQNSRILLLFDRSLSSLNRVSASSDDKDKNNSSDSSSSSSSSDN